ncbi:MAG: glycosyltransferase family 4 protein [Chloroflexota bacterium]|nr:glycosyltransferase family 4 protein [Chloroflexota bacterium]
MATQTPSLRAVLVSARSSPYIGGVETHVHEVAPRLARAGVQVTILSTDPGGRLPRQECWAGVQVRRVRSWPSKRDYYFAPGVHRAIVQGSWDLVHCQGYHTLVAPMAMLAAWRSGVPYVVTLHSGGHSSRVRTALRPLQCAVLRPLLARARRIVAVSAFEADLFCARLRLPSDRFVIIPNGCQLPTPADPPDARHAGPLLVSVGRLERYKGHHRLISALPVLRAAYPDVRLQIVGSGPYESALRRMARQLGVADRVTIQAVAANDREAMAALLARASLVSLLSEHESQGVAILEALALGRPVLVADTSALRELAEHQLARVIPLTSTPAEVARAVVAQLRQPMPAARVVLPTWDDCAAALLALYRSVAKANSCE